MPSRVFRLGSLGSSTIMMTLLGALLLANAAPQDMLDLKIPKYEVRNATMEEALKKLHAWGIQVCLEKVPRQTEAEDVRFSVHLQDASVREVLNALVSADKRYTWERYQRSISDYTNLINVFPAGAKDDPDNLMNIRAKKVVLKYPYPGLPEDVLPYVGYFVPEIARKLHPGGIAGSFLSVIGGKMNLRIDFEFEDMTVREILNEIALRTAGKGWVYEFVKSPEPTHKWRVLQ